MIFELTESVIDEIIFSMENQDDEYLFDAKNQCVVPLAALEGSEIDALEEDDCLFSLPRWSSNDGFNLMEKFAENLHNPRIQTELLQVLANGRGVFRNYKNVLKQYPEAEQRFHAFKKKEMRAAVYEWYNALRESWGLEKLSQDFEDYNELVQEDFEFKPYNHEKDGDCVIREAEKISREIQDSFAGETGKAIAHLWRRKFDYENPADLDGIVCRSLSGDFAACLLFSHFSSFAKNVVALAAVFVNQNYRGLGIARELFSRGISSLKEHGIHEFIIADSLPDYLEPLLTRCGFEKKGSVHILESTEKI